MSQEGQRDSCPRKKNPSIPIQNGQLILLFGTVNLLH